MNETTQVQATMWLMVVIQTLNAIDLPGHGPRKMPAPKTYVAIIVLWSTFGLMIDAGLGRAASAMAWVVVLVSLVGKALPAGMSILSPSGQLNANATPASQSLSKFLQVIASQFGTNPSSTPASGGAQIA
jgi:hypothetical protein